ncbi:hypothetical protein GW758_04120 [Candidatus Falkowbacteria bacterium]|nr:hypothetical protein [Candidatus Falkowbacteria bacterium]
MLLFEKIALFIALVSMLAVFIVIIRKFSILSILNTDNIPGEKEAGFKRAIIKKRINRDLMRLSQVFLLNIEHLKNKTKNTLTFIEKNLHSLKSSYLKNRPLPMEQRNKLIKDLFREAEVAEKQDDGVLAEAKYLDIINFDQKNLRAFFFLGELYYSNAKLTEAIQTLSFALKLAVKEKRLGILAEDLSVAEIYFSLAKAGLELERLDYALESIREALDLEPNNPRYLDLILDLSIMKKDKGLAWTYFNKMSAINPENNKLQTWREEIMALGEDN